MNNVIKDDGWNKDNEAIYELAAALDEAASMSYGINNCTVASTFDDAEGLVNSVLELVDQLTMAAEHLQGEIAEGRGEPSEEDEY